MLLLVDIGPGPLYVLGAHLTSFENRIFREVGFDKFLMSGLGIENSLIAGTGCESMFFWFDCGQA